MDPGFWGSNLTHPIPPDFHVTLILGMGQGGQHDEDIKEKRDGPQDRRAPDQGRITEPNHF
jgi:hypothetical protein